MINHGHLFLSFTVQASVSSRISFWCLIHCCCNENRKNAIINPPPAVSIKHTSPTPSDLTLDKKNVFIFYFVFIPPGVEHWNWLVAAQLRDLKATGLLDIASLTVIAATKPTSPTAVKDMMLLTSVVEEIAGTSATVTPRYENRYEYWGLYTMREKAMSQDIQRREDSVFLYMHSKGMVNHGNMTAATRAKTDGPLFKHVIEPWRDVLFRFNTVPELDKAGFTITRGGYVYFNYIWVRSSYVTRLEAPIERPLDTNRGGGDGMAEMQNVTRFYYEHWIAHTLDQPPSGTNGWSMALEDSILECISLWKEHKLLLRANAKLAWEMMVHTTALTPNKKGLDL